MTTFAPSRAARSPMALPMPRLAPVMKRVLPLRVDMGAGSLDRPRQAHPPALPRLPPFAIRRLSSCRASPFVEEDVAEGVGEGALEVAFQSRRRRGHRAPRLKLPALPSFASRASRPSRCSVAAGPDLSPVVSHARHDDRSAD